MMKMQNRRVHRRITHRDPYTHKIGECGKLKTRHLPYFNRITRFNAFRRAEPRNYIYNNGIANSGARIWRREVEGSGLRGLCGVPGMAELSKLIRLSAGVR